MFLSYRWYIQVVFVCGLLVGLMNCTSSIDEKYYRDAQQASQSKDYEKAVELFERISKGFPDGKRSVVAAQEAARLCIAQMKDYVRGVEFLKTVVLLGKKEADLFLAQQELAALQFEKLANYSDAISSYNRLLEYPDSYPARFSIRMNIAKSHFYLNQFEQGLAEVERAMSEAVNAEQSFQAQLVKGNMLIAAKRVDEALKVFEHLDTEFPELAAKEKVGLAIAVAYEDRGDVDRAIAVLEKMKGSYQGNSDFIDLKMSRLEEKRTQVPGAIGRKK